MKVLLVDDDPDTLDVTAYALRREGFQVIPATDGLQALRRWEVDQPDVLVLDVGLPRLSGFEVCRRIRQSSQIPIILLTARRDEESIVQGFRLGADDYVAKPFGVRELTMRIRAVCRRCMGGRQVEPVRELRVGDLVVDVDAHEVRRNGEPIALTPLEFRLFYALASNPGRTIPSKRLVELAWGYGDGEVSLLKSHFSHVRKKLRLPRDGPGAIRGIPRVGYRLVC